MDTLSEYNKFAKAVTDALNAASVKPIDDPIVGAIMVVVGHPRERPMGGAINFDAKAGVWGAEVHVQEGEPCNER